MTRNPRITMIAMTAMIFLVHCKKDGSKDSHSVNFSGTLNLENSAEGTPLTLADDSSFEVSCTTYHKPKQTCKMDVGSDGKFTGDCPNFTAETFSCLLLEDDVAVSNFVFDKEMAILAGEGSIGIKAVIDSQIGGVQAEINQDASAALGSEAKTEAGIDQLPDTLWEVPISGEWKIKCDNSDESAKNFDGKEYCPDNTSVYFAKAGDSENIYSMWQTKTAYESCTKDQNGSTYTEKNPYWNIKLNGDRDQTLSFKFGSLSEFQESMDNIYTNLPSNIKKSIDSTAIDIRIRALDLKSTVDAIRAAADKKFAGVLEYRVPDLDELKRRLSLRLIYLNPIALDDLDFCSALIYDDTLPSKYRRSHSVEPELLCQLKTDKVIEEARDFITKTAPSSCLPKLFYDVSFNPKTEKEELVLRCPGSEASDGSCFNANNEFIAAIETRMATFLQTNFKDGAFDMVENSTLEFNVIHPTKGLQICKVQNLITLKGLKDDDNSFVADFSEHFVDRCEGSGAQESVSDFSGNRQNALIKRSAHMWQGVFTKG